MLIGISPAISPELLSIMYRMGHGDTLVLADAHFPGESCNRRVLRADGVNVKTLLEGILPLLALDSYFPAPLVMMEAAVGDTSDSAVETSYREVVNRFYPMTPPILHVARHEFYDRTETAFAVVMTGETAKYGNLLLTKGVTPIV